MRFHIEYALAIATNLGLKEVIILKLSKKKSKYMQSTKIKRKLNPATSNIMHYHN